MPGLSHFPRVPDDHQGSFIADTGSATDPALLLFHWPSTSPQVPDAHQGKKSHQQRSCQRHYIGAATSPGLSHSLLVPDGRGDSNATTAGPTRVPAPLLPLLLDGVPPRRCLRTTGGRGDPISSTTGRREARGDAPTQDDVLMTPLGADMTTSSSIEPEA